MLYDTTSDLLISNTSAVIKLDGLVTAKVVRRGIRKENKNVTREAGRHQPSAATEDRPPPPNATPRPVTASGKFLLIFSSVFKSSAPYFAKAV